MMAIELPSEPGPRATTPRLVSFGGVLTPSLGGASQRLSRLGDRHALDVVLPTMRAEPTGRLWVSRLKRALAEGAVFDFPQDGFDVGSPGTPLVASAVSGGTSVSIKGLTPYYALREGQFFSVIHAGRRYLHSVDAQVIADASGNAAVTVTPMLRTTLAINDVIELAKPKIEGWLSGNEVAWASEILPYYGLQFSITEAE